MEPGVDLDRFAPPPAGRELAAAVEARERLGLPIGGQIVAFVGRIQPLKAPDVLLRAAAELRQLDPCLAETLTVVVVGGPSGSGLDRPSALMELAASLGIADSVRFLPPLAGADLAALYRAADLVAVPSYNESFGLVALEAQACGTPVVAAAVGGLVTAVRDGVSGLLVDGHDPYDWAQVHREGCSTNRPGWTCCPGARSPTRATSPGGAPRPGCSRSTRRRCSPQWTCQLLTLGQASW